MTSVPPSVPPPDRGNMLPPLPPRVIRGDRYVHPHTMVVLSAEHRQWALDVLCQVCRGGRVVSAVLHSALAMRCPACGGCGFKCQDRLPAPPG